MINERQNSYFVEKKLSLVFTKVFIKLCGRTKYVQLHNFQLKF